MLKKVLDQTEFSDKIIVSISTTSGKAKPIELTRYADRFLDSLHAKVPEYIDGVQGKIADEGIMEVYDFVYSHLPIFLNAEDYKQISGRIQKDSVDFWLREDYKNLMAPTGFVTKNFIFKDPLALTTLGLEKLRELRVGQNFELYNNYIVTKDHKHLLLFIDPVLPSSETNRNEDFVNKLREIQNSLNASYEHVEGDFFGGVLYSLANAQRIKKDIHVTMSIAVVVLLILLIFFYRRMYVPLILFIPSIIGGVTAIAFLYFLEGTISAISIGIGAILLGISLDYALHVLTHYRNNKDVEQLYKEVTQPVLMSSFTTATAFLCLLFLNSEALNDLGIFAAISVVVASIFALILVPLLYKVPAEEKAERTTFLDKIAAIEFHKKKPLLVGVILLFILGLFFFTHVKFNKDISQLNYQPEKVKLAEQKIQELAGKEGKALYLVAYGDNMDQALLNNNKLYTRLSELKKEGKLESFSSIGGVVLSTDTQLERIGNWKDFWTAEKKERLQQNLIEESANFGFRPKGFNRFYDLLNKDFNAILLKDYRNTTNLYLDDFISSSPDFATVTTTVKLREDQVEDFIQRFRNYEGVVAIDREQINESFLGNLKENFNKLILYSIIAVFLILLFFYQNLEISILTILPIGITWVIALGIMALFKIEFNILNIIISTFVFGLGLDYSIFITNASLKEYEKGRSFLQTYQTSILLSVITTLLGIGALVFAQHPALRSVSAVSVIGVLSALLVAFVLQRELFDRLFSRRSEEGLPPFRFKKTGKFIRRKSSFRRDKLYYRDAVLENYRYKTVYNEVRKNFSEEKERFVRISSFIEEHDKVVHLGCGYGDLTIFLSYKNQAARFTGFENDPEKLEIAAHCFRSHDNNLDFTNDLERIPADADVFLISGSTPVELESQIRQLVSRKAKKVILLDPDYPYRWILDLNFEISYRQNRMLVFNKTY